MEINIKDSELQDKINEAISSELGVGANEIKNDYDVKIITIPHENVDENKEVAMLIFKNIIEKHDNILELTDYELENALEQAFDDIKNNKSFSKSAMNYLIISYNVFSYINSFYNIYNRIPSISLATIKTIIKWLV